MEIEYEFNRTGWSEIFVHDGETDFDEFELAYKTKRWIYFFKFENQFLIGFNIPGISNQLIAWYIVIWMIMWPALLSWLMFGLSITAVYQCIILIMLELYALHKYA